MVIFSDSCKWLLILDPHDFAWDVWCNKDGVIYRINECMIHTRLMKQPGSYNQQ